MRQQNLIILSAGWLCDFAIRLWNQEHSKFLDLKGVTFFARMCPAEMWSSKPIIFCILAVEPFDSSNPFMVAKYTYCKSQAMVTPQQVDNIHRAIHFAYSCYPSVQF